MGRNGSCKVELDEAGRWKGIVWVEDDEGAAKARKYLDGLCRKAKGAGIEDLGGSMGFAEQANPVVVISENRRERKEVLEKIFKDEIEAEQVAICFIDPEKFDIVKTPKARVLVIDDDPSGKSQFNDYVYGHTRIVGAQGLASGRIDGILPDGSVAQLELADFICVTLVRNHVQGPVTADALSAHIKASGVSYLPLVRPDGRDSRGGTPYTPPPAC